MRKQSLQQVCDSVHLQPCHVVVWQVNDYQIRLRGMTRRMMATVSELSMYQAHSIKLSADKEALEEVVLAASEKWEVWEESGLLVHSSVYWITQVRHQQHKPLAWRHSSSSVALAQTQVLQSEGTL